MNKLMILPLAAATALTAGCASTNGYSSYDDGGYGYYDRGSHDRYGRYDYDRPDPTRGGYYADDYYRADRRYKERRLSNNDLYSTGGVNRLGLRFWTSRKPFRPCSTCSIHFTGST